MQAEVSQTSDCPAISIVIPVFNAEGTLDECIESLKAQTFGDWEAVCVNDGSRDGSLEKLQRFAEEDARIHAGECGAIGRTQCCARCRAR